MLRALLCCAALAALFLLPGCQSARKPTAPVPALPLAQSESTSEPLTEPMVITPQVAQNLNPGVGFLLGVDRARIKDFEEFRFKRIALVTNSTALDSEGIPTAQRLLTSKKVSVGRVLHVTDDFSSPTLAFDAALALRPEVEVADLTPDIIRPTAAMLDGIDLIVVDFALRGPRYEFDTAVLGATLEEASIREIPLVVFDRPNLLDSNLVVGPVSDEDVYGEPTAFFSLPAIPGLTAGELAQAMNIKYAIQADLRVFTMNQWKRADGNAWLSARPEAEITEQGMKNREELSKSKFLNSNLLMLHGVTALLEDSKWKDSAVLLNDAGQPELLAVPSQLDAITILERASQMKPAGINTRLATLSIHGVPASAAALNVDGSAAIEPVAIAMILDFVSVPDPQTYPWPDNGGLLYNKEVYQLYRRGRNAEQVWRRIVAAPEVADYLEWRKGALLYQP